MVSAADPPRAARERTLSPELASVLVIGGLICQEIGAAIAVLLFPQVGALGMVAFRLGFSAIVLMLVARPALRGHTRRDWLTVAAFGLSIAVMNGVFYESIARIPLGVAVTIEVIGPLVLSVVLSRRAISWVWAALALGGAILLAGVNDEPLDPLGVLFAGIAGTLWTAYILTSAATGRRFPRVDGLALAMVVGGVLSLPFGIASAGAAFIDPRWLALGLAVALLSSAIPYGLELIALRRLAESAFGVLMSLAPALAAVAGFVLLHQSLEPLDLVAMAMVIGASIGAVRTTGRRASATSITDTPLA